MPKRSFLVLLTQYSAIISWAFIFTLRIANHYPEIAAWSNAAFYFLAALSIFMAVHFKMKNDTNLYFTYIWSAISPITTILLIFASELWFLVAVCLLGGLYGWFVSMFFAHFSETTLIWERGRLSGFIVLISILVSSSLTVISLNLDFIWSVALCSFISILPVLIARLELSDQARSETEKDFFPKTDRSHLRKDSLLYLIPWLVYNVVNAIPGYYITASIVDLFRMLYVEMMIFSNVGACIGALAAGMIADVYGRKKALGMGFVSYGIYFALSGLIFVGMQNGLSVLLLSSLEGFSWGIFLVLYFFVIWEDLSYIHNNISYLAAISFYPLSVVLSQFSQPTTPIPLVTLALVSCILIFSSNIFIIAAQELLSAELRKEFDLTVYLEQVKTFFRKHDEGSD